MGSQKLLHQERFIQFCGVLLILSPIANFILSIAPLNVPGKWTLPVLWSLAKSMSTTHWFLWSGSMIVGAMMLKGKRSSWISVLVILGIFIVFDFFHLKKNLQNSWIQPFLSLATNIFIFGLVYMQEFRQSTGSKAKSSMNETNLTTIEESPKRVVDGAQITPFPTAVNEVAEIEVSNLLDYVIDFEGVGPWARVTGMNENELFLECFVEPPRQIETEAVELVLQNQVLVFRMQSRNGNLLTFRCEGVRPIVPHAA